MPASQAELPLRPLYYKEAKEERDFEAYQQFKKELLKRNLKKVIIPSRQ